MSKMNVGSWIALAGFVLCLGTGVVSYASGELLGASSVEDGYELPIAVRNANAERYAVNVTAHYRAKPAYRGQSPAFHGHILSGDQPVARVNFQSRRVAGRASGRRSGYSVVTQIVELDALPRDLRIRMTPHDDIRLDTLSATVKAGVIPVLNPFMGLGMALFVLGFGVSVLNRD